MANKVVSLTKRGERARPQRTAKPGAGKATSSADMLKVLRARIGAHEVPPGAKLGENDLAEEFGVPRTRVREVLSALEQRGLVDVEKVPSEKGPPRKVYSLNAQGRDYLNEFWRTWSFLTDRLDKLRTDIPRTNDADEVGEKEK